MPDSRAWYGNGRLAIGLLGVLAAFTGAAQAQPAGGAASLAFAPRVGQTATLRIERSDEETAGGQPVQSLRAEAPAVVRVLAVEGAGADARYRIAWTLGRVRAEADGALLPPTLGAATAFGLLEGLVVRYEAGPDGRPRRLLNAGSVRAAFERALVADETRPGAFADLRIVALREDFRRRIADPTALADLVLDEVRILHAVSGETLARDQTRRRVEERFSPLTSAAVRTTVTTRLDSLGTNARGERRAVVSWTAEADRDALVASLRAVLARAAPGAVDERLLADLTPTLALVERATYRIAVGAGWVHEVDYQKGARVAGRERVERVRLVTTLP